MKNDLTDCRFCFSSPARSRASFPAPWVPPTRPTWTGNRNRKNLKLRFGSNIYTPLLVVAIDLKRKLSHAYETVQGEKNITTPEPQMTDRYYLRHWFWKCKEYVVNPDTGWSEEARRREVAMHSGGTGYDSHVHPVRHSKLPLARDENSSPDPVKVEVEASSY